eukprot:scaffold8800_cov58-Attheya_sp.AAC.1
MHGRWLQRWCRWLRRGCDVVAGVVGVDDLISDGSVMIGSECFLGRIKEQCLLLSERQWILLVF